MAEIMKSKRTLMESDIPGASLNGKSPRGLTIPQLKRWLQCQNASLKGKKANLVARSVPGSWSGSQSVMCMWFSYCMFMILYHVSQSWCVYGWAGKIVDPDGKHEQESSSLSQSLPVNLPARGACKFQRLVLIVLQVGSHWNERSHKVIPLILQMLRR